MTIWFTADLHLGHQNIIRYCDRPFDDVVFVLADDGPVLAAGAAGGTRLRPALVQVLAGILDEGLEAQVAVDRARLHSTIERAS